MVVGVHGVPTPHAVRSVVAAQEQDLEVAQIRPLQMEENIVLDHPQNRRTATLSHVHHLL